MPWWDREAEWSAGQAQQQEKEQVQQQEEDQQEEQKELVQQEQQEQEQMQEEEQEPSSAPGLEQAQGFPPCFGGSRAECGHDHGPSLPALATLSATPSVT